ncbi:hypothetical protein CJJ07_000270 [Candidozyma auris]|nr:hypothetical protein CJJ07_000270 [[Candida] auris]QEL61994.1 hypothetical protein CJJ09_004158 [[Candida] auris]
MPYPTRDCPCRGRFWHVGPYSVPSNILEARWLPNGDLLTANNEPISFMWYPGKQQSFTYYVLSAHQDIMMAEKAQCLYWHKIDQWILFEKTWERYEADMISKGKSLSETVVKDDFTASEERGKKKDKEDDDREVGGPRDTKLTFDNNSHSNNGERVLKRPPELVVEKSEVIMPKERLWCHIWLKKIYFRRGCFTSDIQGEKRSQQSP